MESYLHEGRQGTCRVRSSKGDAAEGLKVFRVQDLIVLAAGIHSKSVLKNCLGAVVKRSEVLYVCRIYARVRPGHGVVWSNQTQPSPVVTAFCESLLLA